MTELKNIFDKKMGTDMEMNKMERVDFLDSNSVYFVSRTRKNNGVSGTVKKIKGREPSPGHTLSVAMGGSVLSTFFQEEPFYSGRDLYCLIPKIELSKREMLYYAAFIEEYKELYSYGRQANRTFMNLLVPEKHEIPDWVYTAEIPEPYKGEAFSNEQVELPSGKNWGTFTFPEVFEMTRGRGTSATEAKNNPGNNHYIGASALNNGITIFTANENTHKGNSITVATDGSVGASFYQKDDFSGTSNIVILTLKDRELNPYIALFLTTLIQQVGGSFDYGRKWGITRMKESQISLPITSEGKPDWDLMERYIKSLPYSKYI